MSPPVKPLLLNIVPGVPEIVRLLADSCEVVDAQAHGGRAPAIAALGSRVQAVMTHGVLGLSAEEMERMPRLSLVCSMGAGVENIDVAAARSRGVAVCYGPGTNAATTADHAVAMLCALLRDIPALDRRLRAGGWKLASDRMPALGGRRVGIAGLGYVGEAIARRCQGGFEMEIGYFTRQPRPVPWRHFGTLQALAQWAEVLVLALPATAQTQHAVDAGVLEALGPRGYLVNIARGSVVDTPALVQALRGGRIAGAALDVFDDEPGVPADLLALDNVVLTPHVAGRSPDAELAMARLVARNVEAHFSGQALLTPVP